jgi:sec-independent protein translocase protein TatB
VYDNSYMNLGMPEMIFIFLLALILFGPKKLPEIGREIGKFIAEFKRASNDFTYQLKSEIEKAGVDTDAVTRPGAQQTSSFTQTLLPPAVKSAISDIDEAHQNLMRTARMAFDAQNYTVSQPEPATATQDSPSEPTPAVAGTEASAPATQTSAAAAAHESAPVEAGQLTPDPARHDSAPHSS